MMGHTHALSGAVGWMALVPLLQGENFLGATYDLGPGEIIAGALVCAGAALLPDIDHRSATVTQTYGVVTQGLSRVVNWVFGGHRNGTHSLLFAALAGGGAHALGVFSPTAGQVLVFLLIGLALRGLGLGVPKHQAASGVINAMVTAGIVLALFVSGVNYEWLGVAVAVGCLLHFVGDMLTHMGCPLLWPVSGYRVGQNLGFSTDGRVERFLVTPGLTIAVILFSVYLFPWTELLPGADV
jgi:membrane-bound metal-dependent hydrolase YbcI (DUF457 family)